MVENYFRKRITCAVHNLYRKKLTTLPITEYYWKRYLLWSEVLRSFKRNNSSKINESLKKISKNFKNAYMVLKLNGIVRFDFIIKNKEPYLIEVNTIPGFSQESIVPKMIIESGKTIKEFTTEMIEKLLWVNKIN